MNEDSYLSKDELSKAKHDDWWWMYYLNLYDTLAITYPKWVPSDHTCKYWPLRDPRQLIDK